MSDWVTLKAAIGLTLRPINQWPGKQTWSRDKGPCSAALKDTLMRLKRELSMLNAQKVVLQIAIREQDLRQDGLPRSGAVATHPGVILAFESKHGPLRLWFDKFSHWTNNLRAITLHLEHLRLSALYGVGEDGQQYKGWIALPPPTEFSFASAESAAVYLGREAGVGMPEVDKILTEPSTMRYYYGLVAKKAHPDSGGNHEAFVRLGKAKEVLDGHFARR